MVAGAGETVTPRLENFYDVQPPEVILLGGPWDGRRIHVPDGQTSLMLHNPEPQHTLQEMCATAALGPQDMMSRCTFYRWTGSIRDDGLRVFAAT